MCNSCGGPCSYRCPYAGEPRTVFVCDICGNPIYVGEKYLKLEGVCAHTECFKDLDIGEMAEYIGGEVKEASNDDIDDGGDERYEARREAEMYGL